MLESTYLSALPASTVRAQGPGRSPYVIPCEFLEELRSLGFSWTKIGMMFKVSRWTVMHRVKEYNLRN